MASLKLPSTGSGITQVAPCFNRVSLVFISRDLEKILKDGGVTTVIAIGTAAQGAVLYTASGASLRGMKVIVPIEGMSDTPYSEQYTAWHLANAPVVSRNVTLTRFDLMKF